MTLESAKPSANSRGNLREVLERNASMVSCQTGSPPSPSKSTPNGFSANVAETGDGATAKTLATAQKIKADGKITSYSWPEPFQHVRAVPAGSRVLRRNRRRRL